MSRGGSGGGCGCLGGALLHSTDGRLALLGTSRRGRLSLPTRAAAAATSATAVGVARLEATRARAVLPSCCSQAAEPPGPIHSWCREGRSLRPGRAPPGERPRACAIGAPRQFASWSAGSRACRCLRSSELARPSSTSELEQRPCCDGAGTSRDEQTLCRPSEALRMGAPARSRSPQPDSPTHRAYPRGRTS